MNSYLLMSHLLFLMLLGYYVTEEGDVIILKNASEINYYIHEYICPYMLIYLDV